MISNFYPNFIFAIKPHAGKFFVPAELDVIIENYALLINNSGKSGFHYLLSIKYCFLIGNNVT